MGAGLSKRWLVVLVMLAVMEGLCRGGGGALAVPAAPFAALESRFTPLETPVCMEYDVGYRLMWFELARVGKVDATTTIGRWRHRVTGTEIPALLVDMRVDSPDSGKAGHRNRVSIHDRIVAVLTVPDLQALVFSKYTDEYLNPLLSRATEVRAKSLYDTQSGVLDYEDQNLRTGVVSTNLSNREALFELSRKVKPVMEFLVAQYRHPTPDAATSEKGRIVANIDGKVVALRILTKRDKSPACLAHQRPDATRIETVAERGSKVKPREFHAWGMGFDTLAADQKDDGLINAARTAPVPTVVPLVMEYELGLGSVRATMTAIRSGTKPLAGRTLVVSKSPKPVAQE